MFTGLTQLWQALRRLSENVNALALTVAEANDSLRQRLGLDGQEMPAGPPQALQDASNGQEPAEEPAGRPRGRRKGVEAV
jgi:hypothetical protein